MARTFAWMRSTQYGIDHAVDRYGTSACGAKPPVSAARALSGRQCGPCAVEMAQRAQDVSEAAVGTRPVGEEYLELLRAMYWTAPIGGIRERVTTPGFVAWLSRHGLGVRRVVRPYDGEPVALWSLTSQGRKVLDQGKY